MVDCKKISLVFVEDVSEWNDCWIFHLRMTTLYSNKQTLGGGFKYFLFLPLFGEDSHFDEHIFQRGWFNHQLETFRQPKYPPLPGSKYVLQQVEIPSANNLPS